jgi:hypothetical protein
MNFYIYSCQKTNYEISFLSIWKVYWTYGVGCITKLPEHELYQIVPPLNITNPYLDCLSYGKSWNFSK